MQYIITTSIGGEVAMDHSNSYSGQIVVQDVNCTGDESQPIQCLGSTDIDSYCRNSTSIVRINCYTGKYCPSCQFIASDSNCN